AGLAHRVGDEGPVPEPAVSVRRKVRTRDVRARLVLPGEDHLDRAPVDVHYLTEPASRPCTKYLWKSTKIVSGMTAEKNEAGAITSRFVPNWRSWPASA